MTRKEQLQKKLDETKEEKKALKKERNELAKKEDEVERKNRELEKIIDEYKCGTGALLADNLALQARALERLQDEVETAKAGDLIKIYGVLAEKAESFAKILGVQKQTGNQGKNVVNFYISDLASNNDDAARLLERVAGRMKSQSIKEEAGETDNTEMEVIDVPVGEDTENDNQED